MHEQPAHRSNGAPISKILERLEGSPDPAWAVDGDQRIIFMNRSCEKALDIAAGEAIGKECFRMLRSLTSRGKGQCRRNCAALAAAKAGACPAMSLMRVRRPNLPEQWLMCSFMVLDGDESSFLMLHQASQVTEMVGAWSLLSNYASRVSAGTYASPVTPSRSRRSPGQRGLHSLSAREVEVLQCLADGMDTAQVAHELSLSKHTIRNCVKHIFAKLEVHSRIQAVAVLNAVVPI